MDGANANEALISSTGAENKKRHRRPAGQSVIMASTNLVRLVRLACSKGHADGGFTSAGVNLFVVRTYAKETDERTTSTLVARK